MGAQQSTGAQNTDAVDVRRCYYEVLGVERQATDNEIKTAYRKKALEFHPDRNYGDAKNATIKFAEVQSAYEVLSDVQERAWYDSHRDSILRGDDGGEEEYFEHSVRLTSASDIVKLISRFNASVPFTDSPLGFYGSLQETFATLAAEEHAACRWDGLETVDYPDFGRASEGYEEVVKPFYRVWMSFSTRKTFSWRDKYKASDAPDRATRRIIEKENKRLRDEGVREFNDSVRSLVAFVRKRDPRFIPNSQSEVDRQKILRDAVAAQAARSRAENHAKLQGHVIPTWAQPSEDLNEAEFAASESEESEVEHIECVVCNKTFKSEKQYETHEKSKKHVRAVQELRREMEKENKRLNLDTPRTTSVSDSPTPELEDIDSSFEEEKAQASKVPDIVAIDAPIEVESKAMSPGVDVVIGEKASTPEAAATFMVNHQPGISEDDEYAPRKEVEGRLSALTESFGSKNVAVSANDAESITQTKLGKAKQKRAKKAVKQFQESYESKEFKCANCNDSFSSKTKMFNHIKEYDHAQPVLLTKGKNKKR